MAAKPKAKAAPKGKNVAVWDEQLAKYAAEEAGREKMGAGQTFSLKGGIMSFNGAQMEGNQVEVVIVEHIITKALYDGAYDPDAPRSPICYAYGQDEDQMVPADKASQPQHENCADCPMNQWASADTGRGKACKDGRRLALISRDDLEDIENAPVAMLNIPPTSINEWKAYVNKLAKNVKRPPFAFISNISVVQDASSQFKVKFAAVEQFEDAETFEALIAKKEDVIDSMQFDYDPPSDEPPTPKGRGRAAPQKAPAKKAATKRKF